MTTENKAITFYKALMDSLSLYNKGMGIYFKLGSNERQILIDGKELVLPLQENLKSLDQDNQLRDETHINITSFNHVVLLSGQAPTTIMRYRAEKIVRELKHVKLVYNEIAIASPSSLATRTNDTIITTRVKSALFNSKQVSINHVKVVTESGVVFLMGIVTNTEAEYAAHAARRVSGVSKVVKLFT